MRMLLLLAALFLFGAYELWDSREVKQPAGVLAPEEPRQEPFEIQPPLLKPGYRIAALASFDIQARVLHAERYRSDRASDISPADLALGWGPMSDGSVLDHFTFNQYHRVFSWHADTLPIPRQVIEQHASNMHIIPATAEIEKSLKSVRVGHIVHIQGYLVEVRGEDGWVWRSSLNRTDTGNGACEVIWVESLLVR